MLAKSAYGMCSMHERRERRLWYIEHSGETCSLQRWVGGRELLCNMQDAYPSWPLNHLSRNRQPHRLFTSGHPSSWSTAHDTITCMLEGGIIRQSQQLWKLTGAAIWPRIRTAQGAGGAAGGALEVCTASRAAHRNAAVEVEVAFTRRDFTLHGAHTPTQSGLLLLLEFLQVVQMRRSYGTMP